MAEKMYLLTFEQAKEAALESMQVERYLRGIPVLSVNEELLEDHLEAHEYRERTALYEYRDNAWHCTSCGDAEPVGGAEYCPTCGARIVGNSGDVL